MIAGIGNSHAVFLYECVAVHLLPVGLTWCTICNHSAGCCCNIRISGSNRNCLADVLECGNDAHDNTANAFRFVSFVSCRCVSRLSTCKKVYTTFVFEQQFLFSYKK